MNTIAIQKSDRRNELEGIVLSAVFRSFPFFVMMAWLLKRHSGLALFSQPGVGLILAALASVASPVLLRRLEVKYPDGYRGSCEPSFYDAGRSVPQKLMGWFKARKWEASWNVFLLVLLAVYVCVKGGF